MSDNKATIEEKRSFISANFKTMRIKDIAAVLGCSENNVNKIARKLELSKNIQWNEFYDAFVKVKCQTMTAKEMADVIGCSKYSVLSALERLGLQAVIKLNSRHWKEEHDVLVREKFEAMTLVDIAKEMGFPLSTIQASAERQGLFKYKLWNEKCDEYLISHYGNVSPEDIAEHLGTSRSSVYRHAKRLKKEKRLITAK